MMIIEQPGSVVPRMPPELAVEELSDISLWLLAGAEAEGSFKFHNDVVLIKIAHQERIVHVDDYRLALAISDKVFNEHIKQKNLITLLSSVSFMTECRKWIRQELLLHYHDDNTRIKVIFLPGDNTGCGYWRMKLPSSCLEHDKRFFIQLSEVPLTYDELLYYDIVVVQRYCTFDQFYTLRMLKKAGKKIVYEIDDDIFNIDSSNPVYPLYGRYDVKTAVRFILDLADGVIVTTERLAVSLGVTNKSVVYPNSLNLDTFPLSKKNKAQCIFWAGSATHDSDFTECAGALIRLLNENDQLKLVTIGGFPDFFKEELTRCGVEEQTKNVDFMHTEAYFHALRLGINATVGVIPLKKTKFNKGKSVCKGLEYTATGLPIVASDCPPYSDVYTHNLNALLCNDEDEWYVSLDGLLDNKRLRQRLVTNARTLAKDNFDLKKNSIILGNFLESLCS